MYTQFDRFQLSELLINRNTEFTEAMKNKRPYAELVTIYSDIKNIYAELSSRLSIRDINCLSSVSKPLSAEYLMPMNKHYDS